MGWEEVIAQSFTPHRTSRLGITLTAPDCHSPFQAKIAYDSVGKTVRLHQEAVCMEDALSKLAIMIRPEIQGAYALPIDRTQSWLEKWARLSCNQGIPSIELNYQNGVSRLGLLNRECKLFLEGEMNPLEAYHKAAKYSDMGTTSLTDLRALLKTSPKPWVLLLE